MRHTRHFRQQQWHAMAEAIRILFAVALFSILYFLKFGATKR